MTHCNIEHSLTSTGKSVVCQQTVTNLQVALISKINFRLLADEKADNEFNL